MLKHKDREFNRRSIRSEGWKIKKMRENYKKPKGKLNKREDLLNKLNKGQEDKKKRNKNKCKLN